jgi:hypothetical protein
MVVKVALWYELWTSLLDLCWIIFLISDLITEQVLILLHTKHLHTLLSSLCYLVLGVGVISRGVNKVP